MRHTFLILSLMCLMFVSGCAFSPEPSESVFSENPDPIEIFIFSDYFCPPCQAIEPYLNDTLMKLHGYGAKITFVDMPFSVMTPLFSRYFLYAANTADGFAEKLFIRHILFDIARTHAVHSEEELIQKLKENGIGLAPLDVEPIFDQWVALIRRFGINSTPICIVAQPGQDTITYSGSWEIPAGLNRLLDTLSENP